MRLTNLKVIGVSFLGGLVLGGGGGAVYAVMSDKILWHGVGTGLFIIGIVALGLGLSGAAEPKEGWSMRRAEGRRSMASKLVGDQEDMEISSAALAVWALAVGGTLVLLSMAAFWAAAR